MTNPVNISEPLTHAEVLQLIGKNENVEEKPRASSSCEMSRQSLPSPDKTKSLPKYRNATDAVRAIQVVPKHCTLPTGSLRTSLSAYNIAPTVTSELKMAEKEQKKHRSSRKSQDSKQPSSSQLRLSPKVQISTFHPKRKFQITSPTEHERSSTDPHDSLAVSPGNNTTGVDKRSINEIKNGIQRVSSGPAKIQHPQPEHALCCDPYTENIVKVTGDDDDNLSTTSSSSSHDYDDIVSKYSPTDYAPTPPVSPPPDSPYINLRCMVCSRIHKWDERAHYCTTAESKEDKKKQMDSVIPRKLRSRSKSMEDILEVPAAHQHTISAGVKFPLELTHPLTPHHFFLTRSDSHDILSVSSCQRRKRLARVMLSNHPTTSYPRSKQSTQVDLSVSPQTNTYQSIPNHGPYEQVPKVNVADVLVKSNLVQYHSDNTSSTYDGNNLHVKTRVANQDTYKSIKNSGPYEQVPHVNLHDVRKSPTQSQGPSKQVKPIPLTRKKRSLQHHIPTRNESTSSIGGYESIQNNSAHVLQTIRKRYGSMGDLLQEHGTKGYRSIPNKANQTLPHQTFNSILSKEGLGHDQPVSGKGQKPITFNGQRQDFSHNIINLESPEEVVTTSPQALPYAMVWLDRLL